MNISVLILEQSLRFCRRPGFDRANLTHPVPTFYAFLKSESAKRTQLSSTSKITLLKYIVLFIYKT